jgi:nucleoside-diphosphate-sugar epimerase
MILVTGASGLVGLHLIKQLSEENIPIRALYYSCIPKLLDNTIEKNIEWFQCDVLDIISLEKAFTSITQVYHCAAMVSYDQRLHEKMKEVNIEGTANVVNFSIEKNIKKLIHVSSIAAIGKEEDDSLITEKTEWIKNGYTSTYSESKFYSEMEVFRGIGEGLNAAILNPAIILGEGNWDRSSSNLFKIVHDEFPYFTNGKTAWVDVKDVVKAMILLMHSEVNNERYILSAGNFSFKEIFTMMALSMNKKPPYRFAAKWMTALVWRLAFVKSILTGKVATITKETAHSAQQISNYDNSKFLKQFPNFSFEKIELTIDRIGKNFIS